MKDYTSKDIRNVVLLGATKSGKTTLSEAMLFEARLLTGAEALRTRTPFLTITSSRRLTRDQYIQLPFMPSSSEPRSMSSTLPVPMTSSEVLTPPSRCARPVFLW